MMFNRLIRCISLTRKPIDMMKPSRSVLPALQIPGNRQSMTCDLFVKKRFCTSVGKAADFQTSAKNETDESIPEELKSMLESDPMLLKRYKILQLEVDVMRHAGKLVPDQLTPHHWLQMFKLETRSGRRKYLQYLSTIERKKQKEKQKKEIARLERERLRETEVVEDSEYRLHKVAMFMRIYDTAMHQVYHSRLIQAMIFGPQLVIDCGYYGQMTPRECVECAKQLAYMFAQNRMHREPFDLHFCNVNKSSLLMQKFHRIVPTAYEPDFPLNISEKSYTDSFDKSKLVYLTPHCNNEMKEYDPDSVYIIGAIVDKTNSDPLSLAKAKKEGIKMAKLPLDKYLMWAPGSGKRLPLNQMVNILTDLRVTGDWQKALRHVPKRKLDTGNNDSQTSFHYRERIERSKRPFIPFQQHTESSFHFRNRQRKTFNE